METMTPEQIRDGDVGAYVATRRRALTAAAAAVGGVGIAAIASDTARASHVTSVDGFDGYNNVMDPALQNPGVEPAYNDGTHPNETTAAIQKVITDSAAQKRTVYFPPGTYSLNNVLFLDSYSVLRGHGPLSVLRADAAFNTMFNTTTSGSQHKKDIHIEDLTLDANSNLIANVIKVLGAAVTPAPQMERIWIRRVEVKNHLYSSGTTYAQAAIWVGAGGPSGGGATLTDGGVEDCFVHDAHKDGISVGAGNFIIRGNLVERCGDDHIAAGGDHLVVADNVCIANRAYYGAAIFVIGDATITGNICVGGVRAGINLRGGSKNMIVANNVILDSGVLTQPLNGKPLGTGIAWGVGKGSGIFLQAQANGPVERIKVRNNFIQNPRNHGVVIGASQETVKDLDISGNWISLGAPSSDGDVGQSGVIVVGGVASAGTNDTLPAIPVTNVRVCDNDIVGAKGPGIQVKGSSDASKRLKRWDIRGNRVLDSGSGTNQPGILVEEVDGFLVTGNRAQDTRSTGQTQNYGLQIVNPHGSSLVDGNLFSENGTAGISPASPATGVTYGDNVV